MSELPSQAAQQQQGQIPIQQQAGLDPSAAKLAEEQLQEQGTTSAPPQPRPLQPVDTDSLDPRFDRDDLRQGHPPPAARSHIPKLMKIRRSRKNKGKPYNKDEERGAAEADLTDDEVEIEDDSEQKQKGGLLHKVTGK